MGRKGGEVFSNGLLVSNVAQHPLEEIDPGARRGTDLKACAHAEHGEGDALHRHRLAAGVGSGDDEDLVALAQAQVVGHRAGEG